MVLLLHLTHVGVFYFMFYNSTNRALHVVHVVYQYVSGAAGSVQEPNATQRRDVTYIYHNQEGEKANFSLLGKLYLPKMYVSFSIPHCHTSLITRCN